MVVLSHEDVVFLDGGAHTGNLRVQGTEADLARPREEVEGEHHAAVDDVFENAANRTEDRLIAPAEAVVLARCLETE